MVQKETRSFDVRTSVLIQVKYPDSHLYTQVSDWVKNNCHRRFYSGTAWENWEYGKMNRMYEFELEEDAFIFSLRWCNE
jgi:hypothetical protein